MKWRTLGFAKVVRIIALPKQIHHDNCILKFFLYALIAYLVVTSPKTGGMKLFAKVYPKQLVSVVYHVMSNLDGGHSNSFISHCGRISRVLGSYIEHRNR